MAEKGFDCIQNKVQMFAAVCVIQWCSMHIGLINIFIQNTACILAGVWVLGVVLFYGNKPWRDE